jgi:hypothetical protein
VEHLEMRSMTDLSWTVAIDDVRAIRIADRSINWH